MRTSLKILAAAALAISALGCYPNTEPTSSTPPTCDGTTTGPLNNTLVCHARGQYKPAGAVSTVIIDQDSAQAGVVFVAQITMAQPLHVGTYSASYPGLSGSISYQGAPGAWLTTTHSGTNQGLFLLKIDKMALLATSDLGAVYLVQGTLDATLPAASGSSTTGTLSVHIEFKY